MSSFFSSALRPIRPTLRSNMNAQVAVAAAVAGIGAYTYYRNTNKPVFATFGPRKLELQSAELINHNTKRLRFALPDASQPSGLALTSALVAFSFPNGGWVPAPRPYTPTSDIDQPGFVEFMVKLYPGGKGSGHLHSMKPGDKLTFLPVPGFKWTPNKHEHVALIAGGAGITPMYQLARGILKNPEDHTRVTLVWGVNTDEDIFLGEQFSELEKKYPSRFKAVYVVASPDVSSPHHKGFVTKQILEGAGLNAKSEKNKDIKVLLCGPDPMLNVLAPKKGTGVLNELGYNSSQIFKF